MLLSVVGSIGCVRVLTKLFDEDEFLSPYGLRALSAYHRDHPYQLEVEGYSSTIDYEPAESTTSMFGGNSNWRGPVWYPLNYLVCSALERYGRFFGEDVTLEFPTGSGNRLPLDQIAENLRGRLDLPVPGRRPTAGARASVPTTRCRPTRAGRTTSSTTSTSTATPGQGLGATHQTGWTGLVADQIRRHPNAGARAVIDLLGRAARKGSGGRASSARPLSRRGADGDPGGRREPRTGAPCARC